MKGPPVNPKIAAAEAAEKAEKRIALWYYQTREATYRSCAEHFGIPYPDARAACTKWFDWAKAEAKNGNA